MGRYINRTTKRRILPLKDLIQIIKISPPCDLCTCLWDQKRQRKKPDSVKLAFRPDRQQGPIEIQFGVVDGLPAVVKFQDSSTLASGYQAVRGQTLADLIIWAHGLYNSRTPRRLWSSLKVLSYPLYIVYISKLSHLMLLIVHYIRQFFDKSGINLVALFLLVPMRQRPFSFWYHGIRY